MLITALDLVTLETRRDTTIVGCRSFKKSRKWIRRHGTWYKHSILVGEQAREQARRSCSVRDLWRSTGWQSICLPYKTQHEGRVRNFLWQMRPQNNVMWQWRGKGKCDFAQWLWHVPRMSEWADCQLDKVCFQRKPRAAVWRHSNAARLECCFSCPNTLQFHAVKTVLERFASNLRPG